MAETGRIAHPTIGGIRQHSGRGLRRQSRGDSKNGGFPPFPQLGTGPANLLAWPMDGPAAETRRLKMTLSFTMQKLALSVFGALVASSLFISAAIGPVPVI
jgi:hypothetical protein